MSQFKKIAIIIKEKESNWRSCQLITSNLLKSYKNAFINSESEVISVPEIMNAYDAYKLASKIKDEIFDLIIWLDHQPNPSKFLMALHREFAVEVFRAKPKLVIHLFGDFVLDCRKWNDCQEALKNLPVHFHVASNKQKQLVDSLFLAESDNVSVCPFPVDETLFNFNDFDLKRKKLRQELKIDRDEKLFVYSGRISFQKNIDVLIKIFDLISTFTLKKAKLVLAGPWDDILVPYFGKRGVCGSYYHYFHHSMKDPLGENILFTGNLSSEDLVALYSAADGFLSLSTYNDEDFGMSPAEALCLGLPCLLSDWAGYSNFQEYSKNVNLIAVKKNSTRPLVDSMHARKELLKMFEGPTFSKAERMILSKEAYGYLSIEAISIKITTQIENLNFSHLNAFSKTFDNLCSSFSNNPMSPFKDELYQEIYAVY